MILYTIDCPKCKVLERKLNDNNLKYEVNKDIDYMQSQGMLAMPMLELDDGRRLTFEEAIMYLMEAKNG